MSDPPKLKITRLAHASELPIPAYKSTGAAGLDLSAAVPADAPLLVAPGARTLVATGLVVAIPPGHEGQVRPRSGLALEHGLTVLNTPGTIDSDYRGELKVLLINHGARDTSVVRGMRIAQLVIAPVVQASIVEMVDEAELGATERGAGGFGSTGSN